MKKGNSSTIVFIIIVIIVIAIGAAIYFMKNKSEGKNTNPTSEVNSNGKVAGTKSGQREIVSTEGSEILIFYGSTCPHCKVVNEFIVENNIDKVVPLQHLEVYSNKSNASLMQEKLNQCKDLSEDDKGGVPFLYSPNKCIVGDKPIIDFLKEKAGA